jgi:hypothetical protein
MRVQRGNFYLWACLAAALPAAGCKKSAPPPPESGATAAPAPAPEAFSVSGVELGKAIGPDKRVQAPTTSFGPKDTIYASVATTGAAPSKTITAKWSFQDGQVVKQDSQAIAPTGPAATEFHISKPSGWPAGKYKVEIAVDGSPAGTQEFEVKR